ncbi:MAG TPA: ribonuclease R [Gammaproteobacteria bacterium]|nr:ribonuclease R [Gammaproteobacteria bacterium]
MSKNSRTTSKDPFHQRESANYDRPIASREHLLELIESQQVPVPQEFIAESLGYDDEPELEALRRRLQAMVRDGQLFRNRRGGYLSFDHMDLEKGYVQTHPDGFGFLRPESGGKDIFLPARQMRTLMNGDKIAVKVTAYDSQRERSEGALISILERAHESLVGRFHRESGIEFVVPDDKRLVQDVLLNRDVGHSASPGDIVLVRITEYPSQHSQAIGVIERVLGQENAPGMEVTIAVNTHHIPHRWSDEVLGAVKNFSEQVAESDKRGRRDLRDLAFVTIDGADARDFDDAVYCESRGMGHRLYVAIADVAHYVPRDSVLDRAALERGTSVYFPGEVIPMLPEILSNGLCSLKPEVDRLCLVCEMDINDRGTIERFDFFEAVIHSRARLIYDDVAAVVFDGDKPGKRPIAGVVDDLQRLRGVYQSLAKARKRRHAIEFETREVVFKYDDERKIEAILPYQRNQAHMLIEECMIAANICAAQQLKRRKLPTLFRIHEGVNVDKLPNLQEFLSSFGIPLGSENPTPEDFARIVEQARGRPEAEMIQTVILRSLLQASYSPNGKFGHFGLALKDYAHFTSPIRRYPDLLVHRGLKYWIHHHDREGFDYDLAQMTALGETCSRYERRADDATRDAADWLKCEFLQKHIGSRYHGIVSGVTNFGLFVQLDDLLIDGLVHVTALKRDYYQFDPAHHRLVGEQSGRQYRLGDRLEVEVARVDMEERKIDFDLVAAFDEKPAGKTRRKGNRHKGGKGGKKGRSGKTGKGRGKAR